MLDTQQTQRQAFATGTWSNLVIQWVRYLSFCLSFGLHALPADDEVLAWYAQFLSYTFQSHSLVVNYLSGVKTLHILLGFSIQGFNGLLVKLTVRGLRRKLNCFPRQALAINPLILTQIYHSLNNQDPTDVTFWAISITSFFLLL